MRRVIYLSSAGHGFRPAELERVLEVSLRNNARDAVTGLLAYHDGCFFQVIEGPDAAIGGLLERLKLDTRHSNVLTLSDTPVELRAFPDWNMALVPKAELARLSMDAGISLSDLSSQPHSVSTDARVNILFSSFLRNFRDLAPRHP